MRDEQMFELYTSLENKLYFWENGRHTSIIKRKERTKTMRKKITMAVCMAALSVCFLVGCGQKAETEPQELSEEQISKEQESPAENISQEEQTPSPQVIPKGFSACDVRVWDRNTYNSTDYTENGFEAFKKFTGQITGTYNLNGKEYLLDSSGTLYFTDVQYKGLLLIPKVSDTGLKDLAYVNWTGADYGKGKVLAMDSENNYIVTDSSDKKEIPCIIRQQGKLQHNTRIIRSSLINDNFVADAVNMDEGKTEKITFSSDGIYTDPEEKSKKFPYSDQIKEAYEGWYLTKDGILYGEEKEEPFAETKDIRFSKMVRLSSGNTEDPFFGIGAVSTDNVLYLLMSYGMAEDEYLLMGTVSGFEGEVERVDQGVNLVIKTDKGYFTGYEKIRNAFKNNHVKMESSVGGEYNDADIKQPIFESVFLKNDGIFIVKDYIS